MTPSTDEAGDAGVDVLVVGAGPVGSALAVELGSRGVRCLVVEQRTARTLQPRAKLTNVRTMTLMRRWGLADEVRASAPLPPTFSSDIAFVTRLTGWELTRFPNALSTARDRSRPFPEPAQQVPQDILGDVLRRRIRALPSVELRTGVAFERLERCADGVLAHLRDVSTGYAYSVHARYVAGCDGARSVVRDELEIDMDGKAVLAHNVAAVLRAPDLWSRHDKAPAVHYWTVNRDTPGILGPLDASSLWWFHLNQLPHSGRITDDEIRALFYRAVGLEFPCDVLANDPWTAARLVARQYRRDNVFLLGDAAHLHPPMGGYGMNMGIGDAVDLGWKLAAVLAGWGGPRLLASYEAERRPIHLRVIEEAAGNYAKSSSALTHVDIENTGPAGEQARESAGARIKQEKAREFASLGVQLGYRYESSPIIVPDGTAPTPNDVSRYEPTGRPGHLAPHAWIDDDRCLYDLFGPAMTLLVLGPSPPDPSELVAAAAGRGVPLHVVAQPRPELAEAFEAPLVLVRPDQHVGWRGAGCPEPGVVIDRIRGR